MQPYPCPRCRIELFRVKQETTQMTVLVKLHFCNCIFRCSLLLWDEYPNAFLDNFSSKIAHFLFKFSDE